MVFCSGLLSQRTCSLGVSVFPEHGRDCETLMKNADAAMYRAKEDGRNRYHFFTEDLNIHAMERLTLENDSRQAIEEHEFFAISPETAIGAAKITDLKRSLIRWNIPSWDLFLQTNYRSRRKRSDLGDRRTGAQDCL